MFGAAAILDTTIIIIHVLMLKLALDELRSSVWYIHDGYYVLRCAIKSG